MLSQRDFESAGVSGEVELREMLMEMGEVGVLLRRSRLSELGGGDAERALTGVMLDSMGGLAAMEMCPTVSDFLTFE